MDLVIDLCSDHAKAAEYAGSATLAVAECDSERPLEKFLALRAAPANFPNPEPGVLARLVVERAPRPTDILLRWIDPRRDGGCAKCEGGAVGFGFFWNALQDYRSRSVPNGGALHRKVFVGHAFAPIDLRALARVGIVPGHEAVRREVVRPSELREVAQSAAIADPSALFVLDPSHLRDLAEHTLTWLSANPEIGSRLPPAAYRVFEDVSDAAASFISNDWDRFHEVAVGEQTLSWRWWSPER